MTSPIGIGIVTDSIGYQLPIWYQSNPMKDIISHFLT